jgi:hypothetical protein
MGSTGSGLPVPDRVGSGMKISRRDLCWFSVESKGLEMPMSDGNSGHDEDFEAGVSTSLDGKLILWDAYARRQ